MDDRFENLIHKRDLKLAVILLGLFCVMVLTVSRLAYWIGRFPSTNLMRHSAYLVIGMLIGVACLISVWTTLGQGSFIRRTIFLVCAAAAIFAAWVLGLVATFDPEPVRLSAREEVYSLGLLPTVFLTLCLPLVVLRWGFGLALADRHRDVPQREPITTTSLLTVTAMVASCLGGIQLFVARVDEQVLGPIAICCGCSFLAGLLGVLPAVMFLCSSRRNYLAWSLVLNLIGSLFFTGAIVGAIGLMGAWISLQDALSILEGSLAATATFSIGIGIIRLFGFRLAKHFDAPILK